MAASASALDPEQHMNLVSKDGSVFGVPGFDVTGYQDGFSQCKHEYMPTHLLEIALEST